MSLLPCTSHANPTTPFWASASGGGGGGSTYCSLGNVTTDSNTSGIPNNDTWNIGVVSSANHYPIEGNFYTVGVTLNIADITTAGGTYDGNVWVTLNYTDGVTVSRQGRQTLRIADFLNNFYSASLVIGFQHITGGALYLTFSNLVGDTITQVNCVITDFYCINQGTSGATTPIF